MNNLTLQEIKELLIGATFQVVFTLALGLGVMILLITFPLWYLPYVVYRKVKYGHV